MTRVYTAFYNGRSIAKTYISPNPNSESEVVATVVPIDRRGDFSSNTLEIVFEKPLTEFFSAEAPDEQIHQQMLAGIMIEPWKVEFVHEARDA